MRKPIPKNLRLQVYEKYGGHCAYCGCELEYKDMQVDHVESIAEKRIAAEYARFEETGRWTVLPDSDFQDDRIENLMPACRMCNYYKGDWKLEDFRNRLTTMLMRNVRLPFDYRLAIKYGLVVENVKPIKFYFENESK